MRSVPEVRAFALQRLPDLTPEEREIVQTRLPTIGHANYVEYYFWWSDPIGEEFLVVETGPPPCDPRSARRTINR